MNETLLKKVKEATYAFYENYIHKIALKTPKYKKMTLCECEITKKININNQEHIYFTTNNSRYILKNITMKDIKNVVGFNNFDKFLIHENNKYTLSDIIYTLDSHNALCNICYDIKLLTESLYECKHNNICIDCNIKWNTNYFNYCPLCRAENNFRKLVENRLKQIH